MKRLTELVNPFIGTAGLGHTLVGPQRPHGMVKLGPDTISLPCGGYDYNDGVILGFSHTHLEGVGGRGGRGNIMLTASTGKLLVEESEFASTFLHEDETARVGYYQVRLQDYDVNVELTATEHCGYHRYTFPKTDCGHLLLDVGHTLGYKMNNCNDGELWVESDRSFSGYGCYPLNEHADNVIIIYFYGETSIPFSCCRLWNRREVLTTATHTQGSKIGLAMDYSFEEPTAVEVKLAISCISVAKAKGHLVRELEGQSFTDCEKASCEAWERVLGRIMVEGKDEDSQVQFYSALYRSLNQPTDYREQDEYFDGVGGRNVYHSEGHGFYCDDWAIWDTFRTTHPLQNIIEPERAEDQALSLLRMYEHGGWLPMCTAPALGYNQTMIGHNASSVLLDVVATGGAELLDKEAIYEAMKKQATCVHEDAGLRMLGANAEYAEKGYLPHDAIPGNEFSVSETLEYIYGDWCTAQMAKHLGKEDDYAYFAARALNYKNIFDCTTGFMTPRLRSGEFCKDFRPTDAFKNGFCETTSWEYSFFVPHDIQGIINLIGGEKEFIERLDAFFAKNYYNNQNETGIQIPFLYNYAGAPYKTQETVLRYVRDFHFNAPEGLYGEDDAGAMSAWYVFAAAGLFPVCAGQGIYAITTPNFEQVSIDTGKATMKIRCVNYAYDNLYIQGALLNGAPLDRSYLTAMELQTGGELVLYMGNRISDWATAVNSVPPSMTEQGISVQVLATKAGTVSENGWFTLDVKVANRGPDCTWIAEPTANGIPLAKHRVPLGKGETVCVQIPCHIFAAGESEVTLAGISCGTVSYSCRSIPCAVVDEPPTLNRVFCREESIRPVQINATAQNTGGTTASLPVLLRVNGKVEQSCEVTLNAGEKTSVSFSYLPHTQGSYSITVNDSPPCEYVVATHASNEFYNCSTAGYARFSQYQNKLYLEANGFMGRPEQGILYSKTKLKGDFEAEVWLTYEDVTCPYAPAGMIVRNDMAAADRLGEVTVGAMSTRGFYFNWFESNTDIPCHPTGAKLTPIVSYGFKLRKVGKTFSGHISMDGKEWICIGERAMPEAAGAQHIGLFCQSCSPKVRLVRFENFVCKNLYK